MILRMFILIFSVLLIAVGAGIFLLATEKGIIPEIAFIERSFQEMSSELSGKFGDEKISSGLLEESADGLGEENAELSSEGNLGDELLEEREPEAFSFANGRRTLRTLRAQLVEYTSGLGGDYSIYVKNLDTNEYLRINNRRMDSASLIKLFNFAYAIIQIEEGTLESTAQLETWLTNSIIISCNNSYNYVLQAIGSGNVLGGAMQTTDFFNDLGFHETTVGGTLHPSDFEELHFAGLFTSVIDVGHLLENIYRGTMGCEAASEAMLDILLEQRRLGKIPAGLPEGTVVANKTGERSRIQHDSAIVFSENANYIIVIMSEDDPLAIGNIQNISRMVYEYFNPVEEVAEEISE